jgi:hypothetical protein
MARKRGLKWTRSTVAKAEGGQRELKAGELLLLTYVLRLRFEDLMPTADLVDLGLNLQQPNPNSQAGAQRARSIPRATFKQVVPVSRDDRAKRDGAGDGRRVSRYQVSGRVHLSSCAFRRSRSACQPRMTGGWATPKPDLYEAQAGVVRVSCFLITTEAKGPLYGHETDRQRGRSSTRRRLASGRLRQPTGGAVVVQPGRAGVCKPDGDRVTQPRCHAVRRPSLSICVSRPMSDVRTSARPLRGRHRPGSDASGVRRDVRRRRARD